MAPHPPTRSPRGVRLLAIIPAVLLLLVAMYAEHLNDERHAANARADVQRRIAELRERLHGNLDSDLQLVRGLVAVINLSPSIDQPTFERVASPLLEGRTQLRNIAAAPDMVIRLMAPLRGNEAAIGLDYRKVPQQFAAAERARVSRQVVLAGPVSLVQGGVGFIARLPVFVTDAGEERFWGLVSAVIDAERLYRSAGLRGETPGIELAIRGKDAGGPGGEVFFGRPELFDDSPVLADIQLPSGSWQLGATPSGGWASKAPDAWTLRIGFALVALLVLSAFLALDRALMANTRAKERAESAERQLAHHRDELERIVEQRTRQLVEARDAAEAASQAKTAFLANMSHEIRTPLNAITGMVHLIRRAGVSDEQRQRLDRVEAASDHLLEVINAILDLSKIEANKLEPAQAVLDLDRIVDNVASLVQGRAQAKGLTLETEVWRSPAALLGDATRLQQALLNYASNAVSFTDAGAIAIRVVAEDEQSDAVRLRFEVQDSGVGIDAQTLGRLFTPFEQADNSSTRSHGGTGLGLSITRKLARLMGGDAGVDSAPGQGSRFWFTACLGKARAEDLPLVAAPAESRHEAVDARHAGRRVLLVEDDEVNALIARELLVGAGLAVDTAGDGEQAVEMAAAGDFDLILMDMQMPRMNGLQATRQIRALARHAHTPIVAITANTFDDERRSCIDAGMDGFLGKPFEPSELYAVLTRWLPRTEPVEASAR